MSWGSWGERWLVVVLLVAVVAIARDDLAAWWIFIALAGVFGYVLLRVLERGIRTVPLRRVYDQEQDQ